MCPDDGAIDHVGASIPLDHLGQGLEQRIEHPPPARRAAQHPGARPTAAPTRLGNARPTRQTLGAEVLAS